MAKRSPSRPAAKKQSGSVPGKTGPRIELLRTVEGAIRSITLSQWTHHEGLALSPELWPANAQAAQVFLTLLNQETETIALQLRAVVWPELLDQHHLGWGREITLSPGERTEVTVLIPLFPVTGRGYLPYSGPMRYWVTLTGGVEEEALFQVKLPIDAPPLKARKNATLPPDMGSLLKSLPRTTLVQELCLHQEQPGLGLDFITFRLENIGTKPQFIGLDINAFSADESRSHRRQFYYEVAAGGTTQTRADFFPFTWSPACVLCSFIAIPEIIYRQGLRQVFLLKTVGQSGRENLYNALLARQEFRLQPTTV